MVYYGFKSPGSDNGGVQGSKVVLRAVKDLFFPSDRSFEAQDARCAL